ncbi:hypothetical protein LEP1GSC058_2394 [Leptospira fainei serovar Hurstbridge str. BUT 6]|uniref:Uncharacterized protein n=1 Tax=Leptospira fainei serovar Hurstbridge str. BUT 6 TaxID=1193011 RepID=S3VXN8_9LEPT|nr:hypothetical protein LEP1GSC058_2394 [Leptospira fainei serovar Hurstbridge str. BUT 6]
MLFPITSILTWWFFRPETPEYRDLIIAFVPRYFLSYS